MDRSDWLKEMRREAEERYDTLWAPEYGEKYGTYPNATHQQFILKFLTGLPQPAALLDAACGAGRYFPMLLEKGHTVTGIDQSQGMLASARKAFPTVPLVKTGLQEMALYPAYQAAFDGLICMDAMEHLCPEDWPVVISNFHRALKPQGRLYFTAEIAGEDEIEQAFRQGQQMGLPVVYGEIAEQMGAYHYYPSMPQVREWLCQAGFAIVEEGEGDEYHHFIAIRE